MFVQIIEGQTHDAEGVRRQGERWLSELRPGAAGFVGLTSGVSADGRTITIACFESEAAARAGEQMEMPAELQASMAESPDSMGTTEFLDLIDVLVFRS